MQLIKRVLFWSGVLFMPYVFSWFTLRKSFSTLSRVLALGWLGLLVLGLFLGNKPESSVSSVPSVKIVPNDTKPNISTADNPAKETASKDDLLCAAAAMKTDIQLFSPIFDRLVKKYSDLSPNRDKQLISDDTTVRVLKARAVLNGQGIDSKHAFSRYYNKHCGSIDVVEYNREKMGVVGLVKCAVASSAVDKALFSKLQSILEQRYAAIYPKMSDTAVKAYFYERLSDKKRRFSEWGIDSVPEYSSYLIQNCGYSE